MIRHPFPLTFRRVASLAAGLALGLAVLTGCSSEGASVDCGIDACIVTFDRGVEASVNILGVEARLIGVEGDLVTIEVAGERLSLTRDQQAVQVAGVWVSVHSANSEQVAIRVSHSEF